MAGQDPAEQVKFLVSCIGNTTNGRPDFAAVAAELDIISKAAAQKRYERMLKANGVTAKGAAKANTGDTTPPEDSPVKKRKSKAAPAATTPKRAKKVKVVAKKEDDGDEEDTKPSTRAAKSGAMKTESDGDSPLSDAPNSDLEGTETEI